MRKYLPTFAELMDRLCIVQLKAVFIPENRDAYRGEISLIEHDLDILLAERAGNRPITAHDIRAMLVLMLTNRCIWESEAVARNGGTVEGERLRFTHSINGVRNTAKNVLARSAGERLDLKIDCFAAELIEQYGNWDVF